MDGLRVKLAEINAAIRDMGNKLKPLGHDKGTILAAPRRFDDTAAPTPSLGIPRGSFNCTILEALRGAGEPLNVRQVAERLKGEKAMQKSELDRLVARVRNLLPRSSDQLEGELRDRATYRRVKAESPRI
jgi:hypothetical protein